MDVQTISDREALTPQTNSEWMGMDPESLKRLEAFLKPKRNEIQDNVLRTCLNERWFSDILAWLMDPKADHGLGVDFIKLFIRRVAFKRSCSESASNRTSHLKWGKKGKGKTSIKLSLANSTAIREFYLSPGVRSKDILGQVFCDIAFMDLDSKDSIILIVENKLFGINRKNQLACYYETIESKFKRVKTREYVYLTLFGDSPVQYGEDGHLNCHWVCLSWLTDIRDILESLASQGTRLDAKVDEFLRYLNYLHSMTEGVPECSEHLLDTLLGIASECLFDELQRLVSRGEWKRAKGNMIEHTSVKSKLKFGLLPNYYVTVQGVDGSTPKYEKILIPFGAHVEQVFNLFDIAARDIYHLHFKEPNLYLNDKRKLTKTRHATREKYREVLRFVHDYRYHLQILLQKDIRLQREAQSLFEINDSVPV